MNVLLHRILRKPMFGRFEVPWEWPMGEDHEKWERIWFRNCDGACLSGLWGAACGPAIGTLVLAHPMGKAAKGFWMRNGHADLFRRHSFNVLLFDANGFGESEPSSFDYPGDILAAGFVARQRSPQTPVGLVGASFGAGWGLCAMARKDSPFTCAVLEAAFPTLPEFWRHYPLAYGVLRLSQLVVPSLEARMRPELAAEDLVGSPEVLLIYGDRDVYTPPEHGERILRALRKATTAHLVVVPGADHTHAYRDAPVIYAGKVTSFLTRALHGVRSKFSSFSAGATLDSAIT